jgi:hypothetical protein
MAYRVPSEGRDTAWKQGRVIDMSATGVRFEASQALLAGTRVDLVMDWPGIYHGRAEVRLFLSGTVCRDGLEGTALQITNHDFRFAPVEIPSRFRKTERKLAVA